jgi:hypothetical protein
MLGSGSRAQAELARKFCSGARNGQTLEYGGAPEAERRYEGALFMGG